MKWATKKIQLNARNMTVVASAMPEDTSHEIAPIRIVKEILLNVPHVMKRVTKKILFAAPSMTVAAIATIEGT